MIWNRLAVVTPPSAELLDLDAVKAYLRVSTDAEDDTIQDMIDSAVAFVEGPSGIGKALRPQTWRASYDGFPCNGFRLEFGPVTAVESITYVDLAGITQTLDPSTYYVDLDREPAIIAPVFGTIWPLTQLNRPGSVKVTFDCGYAVGTLPADIKRAMLLLIDHWYEDRSAVVGLEHAATPSEVPLGVSALLNRHRVTVFG